MKYICQTEAVALYLQKYIVYRKRKISFADGSFTSFIELIIKHKDEKFLLALSEPHKPELPETLAKLKMSFDPAILARTVAADMDDIALTDYGLLALYSPSDVQEVPLAGQVARLGETDPSRLLALCVAAMPLPAPWRPPPRVMWLFQRFAPACVQKINRLSFESQNHRLSRWLE